MQANGRRRRRISRQHTAVQVPELIPPYVQTDLMGLGQASDPNAVPFADFISETMNILTTSPAATEICVERVKLLRLAETRGNCDAFFTQFNDIQATTEAH
jgi:uncharacterized oxidoreductase